MDSHKSPVPSTWPSTKNWSEYVGRFSVEFEIKNHRDVIVSESGAVPEQHVRAARISGVVDTGATRLVLPASVAKALGLLETHKVTVRFADGRSEQRAVVGDVQVTMQGRTGVFSADVEPGRSDALIGAIVLEELDFVPECTTQKLIPRDPHFIVAEIE